MIVCKRRKKLVLKNTSASIMDTFMANTMCPSLVRCLLYWESTRTSKERQRLTLGVCPIQESILYRCLSYTGVNLIQVSIMTELTVCPKSYISILILTLVVNLEVNLMNRQSQQQVSQQQSHPLSLRLHQCHRTKSRGSRPVRELLLLLHKLQLIWMEPLQLLPPRLCLQMWQWQVVMLHHQERNLESRMCKCIVCKSCFPHDCCNGLNHCIKCNVVSTLPLPSPSSLLNVPKVHCNTVADFSAKILTFCV